MMVGMERRWTGRDTVAVCMVTGCGRYVDVPLDTKRLAVAEFDHRADSHPDEVSQLRPLARVLDPTGEWDVIIRNVRPTPPGRRSK
jgi:hypothetical protein